MASTDESTDELVVSLRGKMTYVGGIVYCKGVWAMTDASHGVPGQTSDFEFKLAVAEEGSAPGTFPINGKYTGWFALKQPPPLKGSLKIEDKDMILTFTSNENGDGHNIVGKGHNKFGSFNLQGTLTSGGDVHVYREYTSVPVSRSKRKYSFGGEGAADAKKTKPTTPGGALSINKPKVDIGAATPGAASASAEGFTPREGAGRVRKMSSLMKEYEDSNAIKAATAAASAAATPKAVQRAVTQPLPAPAAPLIRQESASDRAQRLSAPLKKCGEILKELCKHPQGMWFLEAVDPIKFNIPDYPLIIKTPMDFGTIRRNLEGMKYDSHESFAEHVRLVFRNAITFNAAKENPVHIAAREMSSRFEDRYRHFISQLGVDSKDIGVDYDAKIPNKSSVRGQKKTTKPAAHMPALPPPGPIGPPVAYLPTATADGSSHQIMEMQRMMSAMQNEINSLRTAVRENEIVKRLNDTQDAAHNPLTFDEKKMLIAQIHKLPPNKMESVLDIIQAAIPKNSNDDNTDIEVPLDTLDTFTLRKLQKFIEEQGPKKRAPTDAPPLKRQSSATSTKSADPNAVKKPRKSASKANMNGLLLGDADLDLLHDEDLLLSTDSFEELRSQQLDMLTPAPTSSSMIPSPVYAPVVNTSFETEISRQVSNAPPGDEYRRQLKRNSVSSDTITDVEAVQDIAIYSMDTPSKKVNFAMNHDTISQIDRTQEITAAATIDISKVVTTPPPRSTADIEIVFQCVNCDYDYEFGLVTLPCKHLICSECCEANLSCCPCGEQFDEKYVSSLLIKTLKRKILVADLFNDSLENKDRERDTTLGPVIKRISAAQFRNVPSAVITEYKSTKRHVEGTNELNKDVESKNGENSDNELPMSSFRRHQLAVPSDLDMRHWNFSSSKDSVIQYVLKTLFDGRWEVFHSTMAKLREWLNTIRSLFYAMHTAKRIISEVHYVHPLMILFQEAMLKELQRTNVDCIAVGGIKLIRMICGQLLKGFTDLGIPLDDGSYLNIEVKVPYNVFGSLHGGGGKSERDQAAAQCYCLVEYEPFKSNEELVTVVELSDFFVNCLVLGVREKRTTVDANTSLHEVYYVTERLVEPDDFLLMSLLSVCKLTTNVVAPWVANSPKCPLMEPDPLCSKGYTVAGSECHNENLINNCHDDSEPSNDNDDDNIDDDDTGNGNGNGSGNGNGNANGGKPTPLSDRTNANSKRNNRQGKSTNSNNTKHNSSTKHCYGNKENEYPVKENVVDLKASANKDVTYWGLDSHSLAIHNKLQRVPNRFI